ncbi:unnamed protein product [Rotaria magnacalcarata]|uniref:Peptidase S1 domain-containing protein n=2 Tax=Rotaria magnacalcarata TaxID=392030 RepID=A0A817AR15_9BILA|nr:unnamed protein product [Rotaria magnacalcarata]CAF4255952.1 unnamed protein product [Rotaria magnacalcarata]
MVQCSTDNRWYIIGITSYAWGCGLPKSPTVFLRVSAYLRWMQENIPGLVEAQASTVSATTRAMTTTVVTTAVTFLATTGTISSTVSATVQTTSRPASVTNKTAASITSDSSTQTARTISNTFNSATLNTTFMNLANNCSFGETMWGCGAMVILAYIFLYITF